MKVPVPVKGSRMWTPSLPSVCPKLGAQQVVHALQDEVHDLDRRVNNAQPLGHLWEGVAEELVIKLDDDLLLAPSALSIPEARIFTES